MVRENCLCSGNFRLVRGCAWPRKEACPGCGQKMTEFPNIVNLASASPSGRKQHVRYTQQLPLEMTKRDSWPPSVPTSSFPTSSLTASLTSETFTCRLLPHLQYYGSVPRASDAERNRAWRAGGAGPDPSPAGCGEEPARAGGEEWQGWHCKTGQVAQQSSSRTKAAVTVPWGTQNFQTETGLGNLPMSGNKEIGGRKPVQLLGGQWNKLWVQGHEHLSTRRSKPTCSRSPTWHWSTWAPR